MKRLFLFFLLALPLRAEVDLPRLLDCIAQVETGNRPMIGAHGERGRCQTTFAARVTIRGSPLAYLAWLARIVHDPTPYRLALAWHAGPTGMKIANARQRAYAERVERLYENRN
jgi:hypothetical protein